MSVLVDLRLRVRRGDEIAMGPGKADLLEAIVAAGSISGAARAMDMSYRRAWLLVEVMNRSFREPLVRGAVGGKQGGGAVVTDMGLAVLERFRKMEAAAALAASTHLESFKALLAEDPVPPSA